MLCFFSREKCDFHHNIYSPQQVVTSYLEYSQDSLKVFEDLASRAGICIVATHNIGQTNGDADDIVLGLNANTATAPTVVLLEPQDIRRLLVAFNNSGPARSHFALIGTTMWSTDADIIRGLEAVVDAVVTLR